MFHAPTTESKQQNNSKRSQLTPETTRELSRHVFAGGAVAWQGSESGGVPSGANRGRPQSLARLHSAYGNQAVLRMVSPQASMIQAKLTVNQPGDQYEQEADRVADQVMRMSEARVQRACACGGSGEECPECRKKEESLQRATNVSSGGFQAPPVVHEVLRSQGQPLDAGTRAFMEPRFGYDFSSVRVHTGQKASDSARAVNARAYTVGESVVFGASQYSTHTAEGRRLLAHELAHVVQQAGRNGKVARLSRAPDTPANNAPATPGPAQQDNSGGSLSALIQSIEKVYASTSQAVSGRPPASPDPQGSAIPASAFQQSAQAIPGLLDQLRSVAAGGDQQMKATVLAAFSADNLRRTTDAVEQKFKTSDMRMVTVAQDQPVGVAASSLTVSHPLDPAEQEAEWAADAIASGGDVFLNQVAQRCLLYRSNGAAAALAGLGAFEAGGGGEAEIATGPPGWVVGGVILLAMAGLAIYVATTSSSTTTTTTTVAPPATAPPPTTTAPPAPTATAVPVPTTTAVPVPTTVPTTRRCPPCPPNPPPEIDLVPPSTAHFPCLGNHWHYRVYNQNPSTCQCFLSGRLFGGCCGQPPITIDPRAPAVPC